MTITYRTAIAIGIIAYVGVASIACADTPDCQPLAETLQFHATELNERPVWMGYSEHYDNTTIILTESGGGWSELESDGTTACIIDYGHSSVTDFGRKGERA